MKYYEFRKNNGNYYSKITTEKGAYNYFVTLKNVSELYIQSESTRIVIVGYNNIYNYFKRNQYFK